MSTTENFAHTIGNKYMETRDLDIAEVAKLVRKDIKAAVKNGHLPADTKYSVRIERFSMGQAINITATLPDRPARVRIDREYDGQYGYTNESNAINAVLNAIVNAYNYDNSDVLTDYFQVRFYCTPQVDGTREI